MASGDSSDSNSGSDLLPSALVSRPRQSTTRSNTRTFVLLKERVSSVPRGQSWDCLNREGRAKELNFLLSLTSHQMSAKVKAHFAPMLDSSDLSRLKVFKSGSRGSTMDLKYQFGLPSARDLCQSFPGSRSKRVYLYSSRKRHATAQPSTHTTTTSGLSTATAQPSTHTTTTSGLSTATAQPSTHTTTPSAVPLPAAHTSTTTTTTGPQLISTPVTAGTNPTISSLRALLDSLPAGLSTGGNPYSDDDIFVLSDDDQEDTPVIVNVQRQATAQPSTHTTTTSDICQDSCQSETVGSVIVDYELSNIGSVIQTFSPVLATVTQCEEVVASGNGGTLDGIPVFISVPFQDICHQAKADGKLIIAVFINKAHSSNIVQLLKEVNKVNAGYFWITDTTSQEGRKVFMKYGDGSYQSQILLFICKNASNPLVAGRLSAQFKTDQIKSVLDECHNMLEMLLAERKIEEERRKIVEKQNLALRESSEKDRQPTNSSKQVPSGDEVEGEVEVDVETMKKIREAREVRIPNHGDVLIKVYSRNGTKIKRFPKGGLFQGVYDWIGSNENEPLYFSLRNGPDRTKVLHSEIIEFPLALHLVEECQTTMSAMNNETVVLKGTFPVGKESNDDTHVQLQTEESNAEEEGSDKEKKEEDKGNAGKRIRKRRRKRKAVRVEERDSEDGGEDEVTKSDKVGENKKKRQRRNRKKTQEKTC